MENNQQITREELVQMGLSEEEIAAVLGAEEDKGSNGLPFPIIKVNYDPDLGKIGAMGFNPIKGDEGYVEKFEAIYENEYSIRILDGNYYQYSKFDTTTNKPSVTSNIFKLKDAKKAYDLKTGALIKDLKANDDQIKWQRIALVEIANADGSDKHIGIFYIKGAFNYELGDILKKETVKVSLGNLVLVLKNKKKKNGAVTFFVPELVETKIIDKMTILKNIKEIAPHLKAFSDWVKGVNSSANDNVETNSSSTDSTNTDDDEDIQWD